MAWVTILLPPRKAPNFHFQLHFMSALNGTGIQNCLDLQAYYIIYL